MSLQDNKETHESYGVMNINRCSSAKGQNLFGSSIKHNEIITLSISHAEKHRSHGKDYAFGRKTIVEVTMSQVQFAEAMTNFNMGSGTPVTISWLGGDTVKPCPEENVRQKIRSEFGKHVRGYVEQFKTGVERTQEIFQKRSIGKGDREEILGILRMMLMQISSNTPFVLKTFDEATEKMVKEAKSEIDAKIDRVIRNLGIEAIRELFPTLPEQSDKLDSKFKIE